MALLGTDTTTSGVTTGGADFGGAVGVVYDGWNEAKTWADDAFEMANSFLATIAGYTADFDIPALTFDWTNIPEIQYVTFPDAPDAPVITVTFPTLPSDFLLGDIRDPAVEDAPEFTEPDPVINLPAPPPPLDLEPLPDSPVVDTDLIYPDEPDFTLPALPTLQDITIPTAPTILLPEFTATAPDLTDLVVPGLTFTFTEEEYTDDCLLTSVTTHLCNTLTNGGTGLNPTVEQAIWDRERNREDQTVIRTKEEIRKDAASRGFSLPNGVEFYALWNADQEAQNKIVSIGRDIAIKQAELEQENIKHAISEAIKLEGILIDMHNKKMQRAFEVAKYAQDVAITLFNSLIARYNMEVELYKAAADVYTKVLQGELAKLEIFKAELDAQRLIGEINEQQIRIYATQVDSLKAIADFYRTTMEAVKVRLEAEGLKIDLFKGQVEGYIAQLDAKKAEYDIYKAQIDGELAKVKVYDSKVQAFVGRIQAYAAQIDAYSKISDVDISREKLRLEAYLGDVDATLKEGQLEATRVQTEANVFESMVKAYSSEVDGLSTQQTADIERFKASIQENVSRAQLAMTQGEMEMKRIIAIKEILVETAKAGAMVASEIAAAALSAMNIGASISGSDQTQWSYNYNYEMQ